MKYTERILAVVIFLSLMGRMTMINGMAFLFVSSVMLLSCLYFAFSFLLLNNIRFRNIFKIAAYANVTSYTIVASVLCGISYSFGLTAFMFAVMRWPGAAVEVIGAFIGLTISSILTLFFLKKSPGFLKGVLIRNLVMLFVVASSIFFLFLPRQIKDKILPIAPHNHPADNG